MSTVTSDAVYPDLSLSECPFPFFEHLREDSPVYKVPGRDEYLVSRHADVTHVLRHPEIFSSRNPLVAEAGWGKSILAADPPEHTPKRKLVARTFSPGRMQKYRPLATRAVDELVDAVIAQGACDFVTDFANPLPILVTCAILGLPREDSEWILRWGQLEGVGVRYLPAERQEQMSADADKMRVYMERQVQQRAVAPSDDALSDLVEAQVQRDGAIDMEYLIQEAAIVLAGGVVTTAHMIASALLLLLDNPEQMQRVRDDRSLIPRMLEESLRLESPSQWQPRIAAVDTELAGAHIPKGSLVLILFASANRDGRKFAGADGFDVSRQNVKDHVAFGFGPHYCVGAPLARLEGTLAFDRLLSRLENIELAVPRDHIRHIGSALFRAPASLPIRFDIAA